MIEVTVNAEMTYRIDLSERAFSRRWAVAYVDENSLALPLKGGGTLLILPHNVTYMEIRDIAKN